MAITLDQLNAFVKAAELGSFSAAAKALGKAQPAISMAIANLEQSLNAELFDRSSRLPTLTVQGEALINDAKALLAQAQALQTKVIQSGSNQPFTLVVDPIMPLAPLASLARKFQQQFPGTQLNILTHGAADTEQSGTILWVIDSQDSAFITDEDNSQVYPLGSWSLDTVVAPTHLLSEVRGEPDSQQFKQHTQLILHPDDAEAEQPAQQVEDYALLLRMVAMGLGWARLPRPWVSDGIQQSTLVRLETAAKQPALEVVGVLRGQPEQGEATAQSEWVLDALQKTW